MGKRQLKPKKEEFHFFKKDGEAYNVVKFVREPEGVFERDAEHRVEYKRCTCKGFQFNGKCKHVAAVYNKGSEGNVLSLSDARKAVSVLIENLRGVFINVSLPAEPYVRNDKGMVTLVSINVGNSKIESSILSKGSGVWEGCLRENGLKVRLIIQ